MEPRATLFGADADQYDRARPAYPEALIDLLVAATPVDVLDVGCGTGIASRQLVGRGCAVLGVEPDARMAAVARRRGTTVDVAPFEAWDPAGRRFDLVIAAQSWHWVDPVEGALKAFSVLRRGGSLAVFWSVPSYDREVEYEFDAVYDAHRLPDGSRCSAPGALAGDVETYIAGLRIAGFGEPSHARFDWVVRYSAEEWGDLLPTHSDHRLLGEAGLEALIADMSERIERMGGGVDVTYTTRVVRAQNL